MDRKTGWAMAGIGAEGATHILRTADGGKTWRDVNPVEVDLIGSFFLNAQQAWAWTMSGDLAWQTQDGGLSWTPAGEFGFQSHIGFNDSQYGWKLNAEVWGLSFVQFDIISFSTTQDGGETWKETNPPPGGGTAYMAFPSAQMAWAVRAGFAKTLEGSPNLGVPFQILTTFDGGSTWTTRQMPLPVEATLVERPSEGTYLGGVGNCAFISPVYTSTAIWKLALTCENSSWIYTTANQGKTWIISAMPAGIDAQIEFINPTVGWLFLGGWLQDFQGDLYQTTDGGQSWTLIKHTDWGDVRLSFVDAQTGWAVACNNGYCYQRDIEKELLMTTDGGQTWQTLTPQLTP